MGFVFEEVGGWKNYALVLGKEKGGESTAVHGCTPLESCVGKRKNRERKGNVQASLMSESCLNSKL